MKISILIGILSTLLTTTAYSNHTNINNYVDEASYNLMVTFPSIDTTNMYTECFLNLDTPDAICNSKEALIDGKTSIRVHVSQLCFPVYKEYTEEYLGIQCNIREEEDEM